MNRDEDDRSHRHARNVRLRIASDRVQLTIDTNNEALKAVYRMIATGDLENISTGLTSNIG